MMNEILWPKKYLPGTTDNFVSNEKIIKDMTAEEVWKYLNNTSMWPKYTTTLLIFIFIIYQVQI